MKSKNFIHKSAIVDKKVKLGSEIKIWHWSHISSYSEIGNNCTFGQNVFVGNHVKIGKNCKIQNNVSVFEGVILGDNVFCGPSMTFTNVKNPRSEFPTGKYQKTLVGNGVTFGANCTIINGIKIGNYSFIGAGAVVTKNVDNHSLVVGNPARHVGWVSNKGIKLNLPIRGKKKAVCKVSGKKYELKGSKCVEI